MRKGNLVVDLFCGAGGFSRGFEDSGFTTILAIDSCRSPARSFTSNFPSAVVVSDDIRALSCDDLRYLLDGNLAPVVIGSPPCEPFTGANPNRMPNPLDRLYKDPVGSLVLEYIRVIECLKPAVFVMENVPAIMEGELKEALQREFASAGYPKIFFNVLKAEDYGTPSHRVRVFISNLRIRPRPQRRRVSVWDAIGDLPPPSHDPVIPNHDPPPPLSKSKLKRVSRLRWGSAMIRYRGYSKHLPNLIRLHPFRTAPTVLGSSRFIHPYENRLLTVREQARLMGFPDHHVFLGGRDEQYNQVGEAVPPPLAKAIASNILNLLLK